MKYKLKYEIEVDGKKVDELTLRRPTVSDIEQESKLETNVEKNMLYISNLAEISPDSVRKIDAVDYLALVDIVNGCFEKAKK